MPPAELSDEEWDAQFDYLLERFTELFTQEAPDASNLGSEVQNLINEHPTSACAEALATALVQLSSASPKLIDKPVEAISAILPSFKQVEIDFGGSPSPFETVLHIRFSDLFKTVLHGLQLQDPTAARRKLVVEDNPVLTSALLGGSCIKYGLVDLGRAFDSFVADGLQLEKPESKKGSTEVKTLAAVIVVAATGKAFINKLGTFSTGKVYGQEAVLTALKGDVTGLVTNGGAKRLLEVCNTIDIDEVNLTMIPFQELIVNGETGFEKTYTSREIWEKVFG
ncbi:hypothetical protein H1R20_g12212, partial [Candolleomyces eurysporus]